MLLMNWQFMMLYIYFQTDASDVIFGSFSSNKPLKIRTNNADRITITSDGT
jgi:hypothetical protein